MGGYEKYQWSPGAPNDIKETMALGWSVHGKSHGLYMALPGEQQPEPCKIILHRQAKPMLLEASATTVQKALGGIVGHLQVFCFKALAKADPDNSRIPPLMKHMHTKVMPLSDQWVD